MTELRSAAINRLDCDGGYLTSSPCRKCALKCDLPDCARDCEILQQIQAILVGIISCSRSCSELEDYSLSSSGR